jgi:hypothetical protein
MAATPSSPDRWTRLVRETLSDMQSRLDRGEATLHVSERRVRMCTTPKASAKRKACDCEPESEPEDASREPETCIVCLNDHASARERCRGRTCSVKVCAVCHADSRGLCPICDRTAINADYSCGRCYRRTPLRQYGYECAECGDHTLCRQCHARSGECGACEFR